MFNICCFYLLAFSCVQSTPFSDSLRFVHVIWRHGDRTPTNGTFPTDTENTAEMWPEGLAEITAIGMRQQYDLGSFLRRRYIDSKFLSPEYNASEIYIRSSDYNRTITSALVNLAAFYPPSVEFQFRRGLIWRPIPVHSVPLIQDNVVVADRPCPALDKINDQIMKSEPIKTLDRQNSDFLQFIRNATGLSVSSITQLTRIFDTLYCQKIHNRTWPAWVTPSIYNKVVNLFEASLAGGSDIPKLQRLKGGPLFREIALRSLQKATKTIQPRALKYYAYSGHDSTIIPLLKNLGAFDGRLPPYASALLIELHENKIGNFIIKVLYLNETGSENLVPIAVKDCGIDCDLNTFVNLAKNSTPANWCSECGFRDSNAENATTKKPGDQQMMNCASCMH